MIRIFKSLHDEGKIVFNELWGKNSFFEVIYVKEIRFRRGISMSTEWQSTAYDYWGWRRAIPPLNFMSTPPCQLSTFGNFPIKEKNQNWSQWQPSDFLDR